MRQTLGTNYFGKISLSSCEKITIKMLEDTIKSEMQ